MSRARRHLAEVPIEPLRRHIQRWVDSHGYDANREGWATLAGGRASLTSPVRIFCERVWPGTVWEHSSRSFIRIMNESKWISFDLADRIVQDGLDDPDIWFTDPELNEAYANVDLRSLDATRPTCEIVAVETEELVVSCYRRTGTFIATAAETGLTNNRVVRIITGAAAAA